MLPSREPVPFIFFFFLSFLFYNEIPTKMAQKWYTRNENCRKPGTRLSYPREEFLNFRKLHKEKKNRRQISKNINTMIDLLQHSLRNSRTRLFATPTLFSPPPERIDENLKGDVTTHTFSILEILLNVWHLVSRISAGSFHPFRSVSILRLFWSTRHSSPISTRYGALRLPEISICAREWQQFAWFGTAPLQVRNKSLPISRTWTSPRTDCLAPPLHPLAPFYALTSSLRAKSSADIDRLNESLRRILIKAFSKTLLPRGWWTAI